MTRQKLVYDFIQRVLFHPLFVSVGAWGAFDILLVDNAYFEDAD
jgi:hypothetical protein